MVPTPPLPPYRKIVREIYYFSSWSQYSHDVSIILPRGARRRRFMYVSLQMGASARAPHSVYSPCSHSLSLSLSLFFVGCFARYVRCEKKSEGVKNKRSRRFTETLQPSDLLRRSESAEGAQYITIFERLSLALPLSVCTVATKLTVAYSWIRFTCSGAIYIYRAVG